MAGWEFDNEWVWASEMRYGYGSTEGDHANSWAPSTVVKVPVGERTAVHAEYFGIFSDGAETASVKHFFSPGIHHLLSQDFEIGIRTGWA